MKRFIIHFILLLYLGLSTNCSMKHKWRSKLEEKASKTTQVHKQVQETARERVTDTSFQHSLSEIHSYQLWQFSGDVKFAPDGSIQSNQVQLQSWQKQADALQLSQSRVSHNSQELSTLSTAESHSEFSKKSDDKKKQKFSLNLGWVALVLILVLGVYFVRRKR